MSSIEQTNIPDPLVGPIVAPPVPNADQAPAEAVGIHAQHANNIANGVQADEEAQLISGTLLPVSEVPVETRIGDTNVAADGVHHTGAKAKALVEASKAQSAQAKKTKAAAANKLQNGQSASTGTSKAGGAASKSAGSCPVGGEAQLNMIFSHLNGLAVKFDKFAKAQDKLLSHAEVTRDHLEEMLPHIVDEEDDDYSDDDETSEDETEDDDSEEDDEAAAVVQQQQSSKRKGKGKPANGQVAKKQKHVEIVSDSDDDDVDEISDREVEDGENAVSLQ